MDICYDKSIFGDSGHEFYAIGKLDAKETSMWMR